VLYPRDATRVGQAVTGRDPDSDHGPLLGAATGGFSVSILGIQNSHYGAARR
jgi:hypothetical protein